MIFFKSNWYKLLISLFLAFIILPYTFLPDVDLGVDRFANPYTFAIRTLQDLQAEIPTLLGLPLRLLRSTELDSWGKLQLELDLEALPVLFIISCIIYLI